MSYNSHTPSSQWSLADKDWTSQQYTPPIASTPVSSWGTSIIHSPPSSYHTDHNAYPSPYGSIPTSPSTSLHSIPSLHSGSSYHNAPLPAVHPALRPGTAAHALRFDVASTSFPAPPSFDASTSAFHPPLTHVTLELQGLHPNWRVSVGVNHGGFVSVYHVLEQIYRHCRSELRREQDNEMPSARRVAANACYQKRVVYQQQQQYQQSGLRASPMLLVDVMGGETLVVGLAPKPQDPSVWVVQFGPSLFSR